jgi:hypothetical protein
MPLHFTRILIGLALMAVVCAAAFAIGDRPVRRMSLLIGFAWMASVLVQLATEHLAEPAIAADGICALVTLYWAWTGARLWLWGMVGLQSCLLVLHALFYTVAWRATPMEALANNVLATAALVLLLAAGVLSRRRPSSPSPSRNPRDMTPPC